MKSKMKTAGLYLLMLIGLTVLLAAAYQLMMMTRDYKKGSDSYDRLMEYIELPSSSELESVTEGGDLSDPAIAWPEVDFEALQAVNPDIVAWLYCEDTPINYPVVQGPDNDYYLKHLFDGTSNSAGCLFVDSRNASDFSDKNTIIYGHNMKNGTMLSCITRYKEQAYYEGHPCLLLLTPDGNYTVELFTGHTADINDGSWKISFEDENAYAAWLKDAKEKSTFNSEIQITAADRIITLSTCSYEFDNARYVLAGKLVAH